jgi:chemotaxis signal transduction protein
MQDLEQMSDEDFWAYARQQAYAQPEPTAHADYLECRFGTQTCLVALRDLAEVLPLTHRLARLPGMPTWMAGIMSWRGETIAVVSLESYLFHEQEVDPVQATGTTIMIASQQGQAIGLLVPAIGFTSTLELEQIAPPSVLDGFAFAHKPEVVIGVYAHVPILHIPVLLAGLVQQIGMTTNHG